jgi:hypothetical protein
VVGQPLREPVRAIGPPVSGLTENTVPNSKETTEAEERFEKRDARVFIGGLWLVKEIVEEPLVYGDFEGHFSNDCEQLVLRIDRAAMQAHTGPRRYPESSH